MKNDRMKRLREKRRQQGLKAREVFLTDDEYEQFKKWLNNIRKENGNYKKRDRTTDS